jgi:hypothetical protein
MKKAEKQTLQHGSIYAAVRAFQQECPTIKKGSEGYGYKYANFTDIVKSITPLLDKHGLGFTQSINGSTVVTTVFWIHEEGDVHTIDSVTDIPQGIQLKGMNTFQVLGAGVSYLKRYALTSILGITTDDDTDAQGEQVTVQKKLKLSDSRFQKAVEAIEKDEYTVQELKDKYDLTEVQIKKLDEL